MRPSPLTRAVAIAVGVILLAGCGSSESTPASRMPPVPKPVSTTTVSPSTSTGSGLGTASTTTTSSAAALPADHVAHDLLHARVTPPLTEARCRLETRAERAGSPFGPVGGSVYACTLARGGPPVAYDVQVLANGCFVAERRKPGAVIYGCGV